MMLSIVFAVIAVVAWVVTMLVNWTEEKTKIVSLIMAIVVLLFAAGGIACTFIDKCTDGESTVEAEQETTTNNLSGQNGQYGQIPQTPTETVSESSITTTTTTTTTTITTITTTTTTTAQPYQQDTTTLLNNNFANG